MANGIGFKLGSAYALKYRKRYNTGSPTYTVIADSDKDSASSLVWSHFFFGTFSNTSQSQTSVSSGVVSGFAGTSSTEQSQTSLSTGTLNEFIRPDTSIDVYRKIGSVRGIKYRKTFSCGFPVSGIWNNKEYNFVWNNWFFGIGSATGQGSQTSDSVGTISGIGGTSETSQGSQSSIASGIITGIAGTSTSGQGSQTQVSEGYIKSGFIVTVGNVSSSITTRCYNADTGDLIWEADHGAAVFCVAADSDGNVYTGGNVSSSITTRKYSATGELLWSVNHGAAVRGIAVDSAGNVYTTGDRISSVTTRKYDSSGTAITTGWPVDHGGNCNAICIDASDDVYTTGNLVFINPNYFTTRKYNSNGTQQWTHQSGVHTYGINTISSNQVRVGGIVNTLPATTYTLSQVTGGIAGQTNHEATVYCVAKSGATAGDRNASNITTRIGSATLDHGDSVRGIVSTDGGIVYTVGLTSSGVTTRKYSATGVEFTNYNWPLNHGANCFGVAWSSYLPVFNADPTGLALGISLGIPETGFVILPSGLALDIALGVPTVTHPATPPDPQVRPGQPIYRLIVAGTSPLELPIASFSCQRRLGDSSFLRLTVPTYNTSMVEELIARRAIGSNIVLYAGQRYDGGVETIGQFLRAVLLDVESSRQGGQGTITLNSRIINPSWTAQNRILAGVRSRGYDGSRRTVKCAVDPLLRPNDTVFDGVQTWTVGAISYEVSTYDSVMTVTQD